jgi:hypothetical protein
MKANFYDTLNLQDGGHEVVAGGPLNWGEMAGVQQVRVIARITQDPTYGSGWGDFNRSGNDGTWSCVVPAANGGVFQPGQRALAAGVVVVRDPAPKENPWPWPARPLLRQQP